MVTLGAAVSAQQAGSIRGSVFDKDFDAPLAAAKVEIVGTDLVAETTDQGNFVFSRVEAGTYTLVFSKEGYVKQIRSDVEVSAGQLKEVNVALSGDFTDMEEFVVQDVLQLGGATEAALLQLRFDSPSIMDSISADFMSRAGASDAASALRLVSGATVKDGKSAVIRGLPDRYVSSQLNGVRLPSADEDKRAVELDQFPAPVIESIQVTKTFTPDQQGDASGGAVDVRLKGIPTESLYLKVRAQVNYNSQVKNRSDFLTYDGGGVDFWGKDDGGRDIQFDNLGTNWDGAVGTNSGDAPTMYKWAADFGGMHEFRNGLKIGGSLNFFYEQDASFYDDGVSNAYWVESPGNPLTPATSQGAASGGDFKTQLFDVTQASESVQWGGLATFGIAIEDHALNFAFLHSRTAEDVATLSTDTRGKEYFFPGHDPNDPSTPGHTSDDAAPYLRLETLEYTERTTESLQLNGRHTFRTGEFWAFSDPVLDWGIARSSATLDQPDKRQFGSLWKPARPVGAIVIPATHSTYKPGANFTLGNLQRIWKKIEEDSEQLRLNLELPFEQWSRDQGYVKVGWFQDEVDREFEQETFSNFEDNSSFAGPYEQPWSSVFPLENHPVTASDQDVDYTGELNISAWYAMVDMPLFSSLRLVGGARFESTEIGIVNDPEDNATWFPEGSLAPVELNPGDADVAFDQDDVLPSLGFVFEPIERVTLRASYNQTIARQTFKELTPIIQQEFLGAPIFIGNPDLQMSKLENWDIRVDYTPYEGGLISASWFRKDIEDPIEYVQVVSTFDYTTARNYPEGELTGFELETRQDVGFFVPALEGLSVGANATFIESEVTLPEDEALGFEQPNIQAPMRSRDMTGAPEYLLNLYATYDIAATRTQASIFYTVQGDTLVAGAGESTGNFVPNVYATDFDTLNIAVTQALGEFFNIRFQAKNLTNPEIETVFRSEYTGPDLTRTSFTQGIDYSISIGGSYNF